MRRKTFAYNSIIIGALLGMLVWAYTENTALGIAAAVVISVAGFFAIRGLEHALDIGSQAAADALARKIAASKKASMMQEGSSAYRNGSASDEKSYGGNNYAALGDDFSVPDSPDIHISAAAPVLSVNPVPRSSAEQPAAVKNFCWKCGARLQSGGRFCPKCGTPVRQKTENASEGAVGDKN